jgi:O-antigen/teichoic acid export membrane protein
MIGQGLLPLHRMMVSRLFGPSLYGTYRVANDFIELLARTGMIATDKGLLRFLAMDRIANDHEAAARTAGSGLRLATVAGIVLSLAVAVAAPWLAAAWGIPALGSMFRIMAPGVLAGDLAIVLVAATLAAKVTRVNLLVRGIGEPFLLVALTLVAAVFGRTAVGLATAYSGAYLALVVVAATAAAAIYGARWLLEALRKPARAGFASFIAPLAVAELANALLSRAHVFLLGGLSGPNTVALFAAAEELGRPAAAVRYVFDPIAAVAISECFRLGDRARLFYNVRLITRWVASAAAPIAATLIVLRRELLWLYGPTFGPASGAMVLMVGTHLSNSVLGIGAGLLPLAGRPGRFLIANLIAAGMNVALCLLLIPRFGLMGAAIASLASTLGLLLMLIGDTYRLERVHAFEPALAKPFVAAAGAAAIELGVRALPLPVVPRVAAVIAAGAVSYAALLFALRPGEEERRLILQVLAAVGLRRRGSDRGGAS